MELIYKRLANLLSVKSLVTLALTVTFCVLTVHLMVIAFYFGTQSQKAQDVIDSKGE